MSKNRKIHIIGAGGHSKVVIETLQESGFLDLILLDDDENKWNSVVSGLKIVGPINKYLQLNSKTYGIIAIGNNYKRKEIALNNRNVEWISVIHPHAYVSKNAKIGSGTVIFAGAVVQPYTEVSEHVIINTSSSIDHDCMISSFVHIAPGVSIGGGVKIGENTLIGIGTCIKPYLVIGSNSIIGAGSNVVQDIENDVIVYGNPAKRVKER